VLPAIEFPSRYRSWAGWRRPSRTTWSRCRASGIPFGLLEAGQVADEEDNVPGVDVGADGPFGLAGIEEHGDRFADRAQAVRGQGLRHARLDGGEDSALDARVAGHPVEPASQRGDRLMLSEQGWRRRHELVDVLPVDLGEQVLAGREVPVEGALADACLPGDRVELHLARVRDGRPRGRDDPGAVARDVNLRGVLYGIAAALPLFRRQGHGHLVTTLSTAGLKIVPAQAVYAATKNAVRTLLEGLRQESTDGVLRTTAVAPGFVRTELADSIDHPEVREQIRRSR
jgi:short chain dehydrogenase